MQVRAGGQSAHADIADDLALIDFVARPQARSKARQVTVASDDLTGVRQFEHIAIAALIAFNGHATIARCAHRRLGGGCPRGYRSDR